ncbi:glycosyltransferase [Bradyrhizobium sp. SYSU BS000235]|uniref:glycosyltransferase n=1 Tax=Bradyrhizobium sp. SYSU BS000235 TaxID=3411332 RepID=UPI003C7133C3
MSKLLVLVPDYISHILAKGEYQPRYYNPGEVFDEVHILTTTPDRPDLTALQPTVGKARLFFHNLPEDMRMANRPWWLFDDYLLRRWADPGVEIARSIGPALVRCHGADWNTYLASRINAVLGVPYVVSLHINADVNPTRRFLASALDRAQRRQNDLFEVLERKGLERADLVMPVYRPIIPYLDRMGVTRYDICYNALNGDRLRKKESYECGSGFRVLCVGRLFDAKYPDNIIRAIGTMAGAELTIVGDGPARAPLQALVGKLGLAERVHFMPAVPNNDLCAMMPTFDAFAIHSEYWELNKSLLEALLTGLPCVVNRRKGLPVPELEGDFILKVENSEAAYIDVLTRLRSDSAFREGLGRRAYDHAQENWGPDKTEAKFAKIYRDTMRA